MTKTVSPQELTALGNNDDPRLHCIYFAEQLLEVEETMTKKHTLLMRSLFGRLRLFLNIVKRNDREYPIRYAIANTESTIHKIECLYLS